MLAEDHCWDGGSKLITKEKVYTATKGPYVNIPFNSPVHKFTNETDKTAHILCFMMPTGMEIMLVEIGKPVAADTLLPIPQMTPEELKRLQGRRNVWTEVVPATLF